MVASTLENLRSSHWYVGMSEGVCLRSTFVPLRRFYQLGLIKTVDPPQHIIPESDLIIQINLK